MNDIKLPNYEKRQKFFEKQIHLEPVKKIIYY